MMSQVLKEFPIVVENMTKLKFIAEIVQRIMYWDLFPSHILHPCHFVSYMLARLFMDFVVFSFSILFFCFLVKGTTPRKLNRTRKFCTMRRWACPPNLIAFPTCVFGNKAVSETWFGCFKVKDIENGNYLGNNQYHWLFSNTGTEECATLIRKIVLRRKLTIGMDQ